MLVAIPSESPGGLDAEISEHFGHCGVFTLVKIDGDQVGEVTVLPNEGHEGCMGPVMLLKGKGAEALVAGGMGMRPLAGFQQVGIKVYAKGEATTVREAAEGIIAGTCQEFGDQHTCGGGDHSCGGHHGHDHGHSPNLRFVEVDGPVEEGRMAHISYELFDSEGEGIDASEARFIYGRGQVPPGLEHAVEGHVAGDSFEVTVPPKDGYGEHDPERVAEVHTAQLPDGVEAGQMLEAQLPTGQMVPITVVSIDGDRAIVDHNHPFAGKTLQFKIKVLGVLEVSEVGEGEE